MTENYQILKDKLMINESIYKSIQFTSACLLSTIIIFLGWQTNINEMSGWRLEIFRLGLLLAFIVFCLNSYVIIAVNSHVRKIYNTFINEGIDRAHSFHEKTKYRMNQIINHYHRAYHLLVWSIGLVIISKHQTLNIYLILIIICIDIFVSYYIYQEMNFYKIENPS